MGAASIMAVLTIAVLAGCGGSAPSPTAAGAPTALPGSGAAAGSPPAAVPGSPGPGGSPGDGSGSPPAAAPGAPGTAPAAGTTLATIDQIGQTDVISNQQGNGFTAVHSVLDSTYTDKSTLQTYDAGGNLLTTLPAGSFTGDCGAADVVTKAGRLIITMLVTTKPAQGITPPSYSLTMTAWNAATGAPAWTASIEKNQANQISCPPGGTGELNDFISTLDGQWGVLELPESGVTVIDYDAIDLTTGKLYRNDNLEGVLGNDVVTGSGNTGDNSPTRLTVTTPGSWPRLGTAAGSGATGTAGLQLSGDLSTEGQFAPNNFAVTGYTGDMGGEGDGLAVAATPDGSYLIAVYSDENGNSAERGYSLPSLHQVWSDSDPKYATDLIAGVNDSTVLVSRQGNDGADNELLALNPRTGQTQWKQDIGSGSVCDLTSTQVLVEDNDQLATLSAPSGKQLSYESDPYTDDSGGSTCPSVVETGLSGVGMNNNNQVVQLLTP